MGSERRCDRLRERHAIDRKRTAGGEAMLVRRTHDERACAAHFFVQETDGIVLGVVRAEGVGADEFGQTIRDVRFGTADGAHLVQDNGNAGLRSLPCGFAASQAAADDVKVCAHWLSDSMIERAKRTKHTFNTYLRG